MTRMAWHWLAIVALVGVLVASIVFVWRHRHRVDALPPAVVTAVEHEKADRPRVDSTVIADTLEAHSAERRAQIATGRADSLADIARRIGRFADSLAEKAVRAKTAEDSARFYRFAYLTRTDEASTLRHELAEKDTAIANAEARAEFFRHALIVSDSARQRADSVMDAVVHAATQTECRVLWVVHCISRKKAFIVGAAAGVGGKMLYDAIRDGRIRIPLRLP